MAAAEFELAGELRIHGIAVRNLRRAKIAINGRYSRIGHHAVEPALRDADLRLAVAEVQENAGGAHRAERRRRHDVDFLRRLPDAVFVDVVLHLLRGQHDGLPACDLVVDLIVRFHGCPANPCCLKSD